MVRREGVAKGPGNESKGVVRASRHFVLDREMRPVSITGSASPDEVSDNVGNAHLGDSG